MSSESRAEFYRCIRKPSKPTRVSGPKTYRRVEGEGISPSSFTSHLFAYLFLTFQHGTQSVGRYCRSNNRQTRRGQFLKYNCLIEITIREPGFFAAPQAHAFCEASLHLRFSAESPPPPRGTCIPSGAPPAASPPPPPSART